MTFATLAAELFRDVGHNMPLDRINVLDRRRLINAYLAEHPECFEPVLAAVREQLNREWQNRKPFDDSHALLRRQAS